MAEIEVLQQNIEEEEPTEETPFVGSFRPPDLPLITRVRNFFYNPETRRILGRTYLEWGRVILFYVAFYMVLAMLFAICMWTLLATLDPKAPRLQNEYSFIGTTPGLSFRPAPYEDNSETSIIWFKSDDEKQVTHWTKKLEKFLEAYNVTRSKEALGQNVKKCGYDNLPSENEICLQEMTRMGPCKKKYSFGYHIGVPCIIFKINKVYGWKPTPYTNVNNLPDYMPNGLKKHILKVNSTHPEKLNTVWIHCDGEKPADKEHIGPVQYYPTKGFPAYFYPYKNQDGYQNPFVAVHFEQPKRGVLISVKCTVYAENMDTSTSSAVVQLMVD